MTSTEASAGTAPGAAGLPLFFSDGVLVAHFIVTTDVERSRRFYTDVLGGVTVRSGGPTYVALANSWIDSHPVLRVESARRRVPDAADPTRDRDPVLHPGPRQPSGRGRPDHPTARLT